jgi:hypothetical protein
VGADTIEEGKDEAIIGLYSWLAKVQTLVHHRIIFRAHVATKHNFLNPKSRFFLPGNEKPYVFSVSSLKKPKL